MRLPISWLARGVLHFVVSAILFGVAGKVAGAKPNQPPSVSMTAPANGATFTAPASVTISASASDSDGAIAKVEFYQGSTLLGTATTAPYSIAWSNVAAGSYTLSAKAFDNLGATKTSATVGITVGP